MLLRTRSAFLLLLGGLALSACAYSKPNPTDPNYGGSIATGNAGSSMLGGEGLTFGTAKQRPDDAGTGTGTGLGVNAYLWRGALDTLSFMPLSSADPFGGVIITDWYSPAGSDNERFKATVYILGRQLRSDGVRVAIFRQVLQDGHWVDSTVSPVTVGEIENKVLSRARQLRAQSASAQ